MRDEKDTEPKQTTLTTRVMREVTKACSVFTATAFAFMLAEHTNSQDTYRQVMDITIISGMGMAYAGTVFEDLSDWYRNRATYRQPERTGHENQKRAEPPSLYEHNRRG